VEAAEAVSNHAGELGIDSFDTLVSLVDRSLVREEEGVDGEPRFSMLETLREYALERLHASGEGEELRRRHAQYFLGLAEAAKPEMRGSEQAFWLRREQEEHDNLRAALTWASSRGEGEHVLRLAVSLFDFWCIRGYLSEGRSWLEKALAAPVAGTLALRAEALQGVGDIALTQGDYDQAQVFGERGLLAARQSGDMRCVAKSLHDLGEVAVGKGEYERARALYEESAAIARELGEKPASTIANLADLALAVGDYERAAVHAAEALALQREGKNKQGTAISLFNLASAHLQCGRHTEAAPLLRETILLSGELGFRDLIAECCMGVAAIVRNEQARAAARMLGAAEEIRELTGSSLGPAERRIHARTCEAIEARLGQVAFRALKREGRRMSVEDAATCALNLLEESLPS
jgi:tetratricopeptide (TPR) repeat protein